MVDRQADDQLQAVFAAGRNAAAMDIDDVFDNIEAKTAAALAAHTGTVAAPELLEQIVQLVGRNTDAVVGKGNDLLIALALDVDRNSQRFGLGIFDGIFGQIVKDAAQLFGIGQNHVCLFFEMGGQCDLLHIGIQRGIADKVADEIGQIQRFHVHGQIAGFQLGIEEEVFQKGIHLIGLGIGSLQITLLFFGGIGNAVADALDIALD